MQKIILMVSKTEEPAYLPAPEQGEPDGLWRRNVSFESTEDAPEERDEIVATLWDDQALFDLDIGDEVLVRLQFRPYYRNDGSLYQGVDVCEIKKLSDCNERVW